MRVAFSHRNVRLVTAIPGLEHVRLVCRFVNGRCQSPRRTGSWRRGVDARPVGLSRTFCDENLRLVARLRLLVPRCDTVNDEGRLHTLHHLAQSEGSPWIVWLIVLCCVTAHRCPSATVQLRTCGKQFVVTQVSLLTPDNTQSLCTVGDCRRVSEVYCWGVAGNFLVHVTLPGRALYTAEWMICSGGSTCGGGARRTPQLTTMERRRARSKRSATGFRGPGQMEVDVGAETKFSCQKKRNAKVQISS